MLWAGGATVDLGAVDGEESWADGVNDAGRVVGRARTGACEGRAVRWDLGPVPPTGYSPAWPSALPGP